LEHSIDSAVRGWPVAFLDLVAGGGVVVVEGGVCAKAALVKNEPIIAAMRSLRI
jgi:hypothetical protein